MGEQKRKGKKRGLSKQSKSAVTTVIVLVCIIVIGVVDYVSRSNNSPLNTFDPARSKGSESAPVRIVEFVDFQCAECARGTKLLHFYLAKHPRDIFLTVKYYPLGELNSMISAIYGQCAAEQGRFWRMHDLLFERQAQWRLARDAKTQFNAIAQNAGLNIDEMNACVNEERIHSLVLAERMLRESHFVKSTPTYFINDEIVVGVEELRQALEKYFK